MLSIYRYSSKTNYHLTKDYFISKNKIIYSILKVLKKFQSLELFQRSKISDIGRNQKL